MTPHGSRSHFGLCINEKTTFTAFRLYRQLKRNWPKRENQSDPRLDWFMFYKTYHMYGDTKNKEQRNYALLITSMSENKESNKVNEELKYSRDNDDGNQPILKKKIIPSDLNDIQPRATQIWRCDEVGFDPNKIWIKVIYTYKFFQGK